MMADFRGCLNCGDDDHYKCWCDYVDPDLIMDESIWPAWFGWVLSVVIFGGMIALGVVWTIAGLHG